MKTDKAIRHIAGEMTDGVQYCVVCGAVLADYRGAVMPAGSPRLNGWPEGPIYKEGNLTMVAEPESYENCKP